MMQIFHVVNKILHHKRKYVSGSRNCLHSFVCSPILETIAAQTLLCYCKLCKSQMVTQCPNLTVAANWENCKLLWRQKISFLDSNFCLSSFLRNTLLVPLDCKPVFFFSLHEFYISLGFISCVFQLVTKISSPNNDITFRRIPKQKKHPRL